MRPEMLQSREALLSVAVVLLVLSANLGSAQSGVNNSGASGSQFLNIGVGARAMGMGGAFAAIANDASALYWNPAGIAAIDRVEIMATHTNWAADMSHEFAAVVVPLSAQFIAGVGVVVLSSGDIEVTTIDQPRGTGQTYSTKDLAIIGTLGWRVTEQLSVAASLKYIRNDLYSLSASGIAFDAGTRFNTEFHGLFVALAVTNLGSKRGFDGPALEFQQSPPYPGATPILASYYNTPYSLPLTYRAGLAADFFDMIEAPSENHKITLAADIEQTKDIPEKLHLGAEYSWSRMLFLRGGYIFNAAELGLNLGFGVRWETTSWILQADYAYASLGRFSAGHRFGVVIEL